MFGEKFCLGDDYPDDQDMIYRYMHLWKFMHMISLGRLYLSRGDQFPDPLEGKETELSREIRKAVHNDDVLKSTSACYDRNRRCVAISCWYTGDSESREMWEKFAPGPAGIVVRSTVGRLKKALLKYNDKLCVRKIEYIKKHNNEFTKFGCPFYPFSIKTHRDFGYENEIRVIYGNGKGCLSASPLYKAAEIIEKGIEFEIDLSVLIDTVIVSPDAPGCILESIQSISCCLNMNLEVRKSELERVHKNHIFCISIDQQNCFKK